MKEQLKSLLPQLRRFAFALTGDADDADDLLQNTVLKLLKQPQDLDEHSLMKWSFRVCKNLWIDEYRNRKVRTQASYSPEVPEAISTEDSEQAQEKANTLKQVNHAMDLLPEDQRSVLALVAMQGLSYRDTAEALKLPLGTVMSRLARARASVSQSLKQQQLEPNHDI
ncbi:RNA polymerase sigma factor [Gayadomonas joobiniege]|uniref:RNA polymerase sigma factor n=1 Tax=Gayadomonas joobiniege TaxID=1234606 RepID=UPI00037F9581|nr:RNA polymerase sigma factor [Gayadomonas joobiniege]